VSVDCLLTQGKGKKSYKNVLWVHNMISQLIATNNFGVKSSNLAYLPSHANISSVHTRISNSIDLQILSTLSFSSVLAFFHCIVTSVTATQQGNVKFHDIWCIRLHILLVDNIWRIRNSSISAEMTNGLGSVTGKCLGSHHFKRIYMSFSFPKRKEKTRKDDDT
jgi:hypothetical protein